MDATGRHPVTDVVCQDLGNVKRKTPASKLVSHITDSLDSLLYIRAEVKRSPRHMVSLEEIHLFSPIVLPPLLYRHQVSIQFFMWQSQISLYGEPKATHHLV